MHIELLLILLATGAIGGFLSGLLGIGGGVIFVPALFFVLSNFGISETYLMHISIASSLAVVLATGFTSAYHHYKRGSVDIATAKKYSPFIVIGVVLGSSVASLIDGETLKKIFSVLMLLVAIDVAFKKEPKRGRKKKRNISGFILYPIYTVIGTLSSMLGIGGSVLTIPVMTYTGMAMKTALGTGSAITIAVSLPGIITYTLAGIPNMEQLPPFSVGYINLVAIAAIVPASVLASPLGVKASHALPKKALQRIFAMLLIIVAIRMFI